MPIQSAHNLLDRPEAEARARSSQSGYLYLFPDLAEDDRSGCFQGTTPQVTWERLQAFEVATHGPMSDMPVLQMRLPPSYTYFGQFVNHDISAPAGDVVAHGATPPVGVVGAVDPPGLDRSRRTDAQTILRNLVNEHPEPMMLFSLYGEGPDSTDPDTRALYEADGKRFRLGQTRREVDSVFTDGGHDPASVVRAKGARDIPRVVGKALIADRRNDENLIVSQLHLALMLLHNKAVAALEPDFRDDARCFAEARALVTRHYHWLILNDWLPQLLAPEVRVGLATRVPKLTAPHRVPLEFTTAAFRFGHSMVSAAYDFNANFGRNGVLDPGGAKLIDLFRFTSMRKMAEGLTPVPPELPDHWVIDWERMTLLLPEGAPDRPFGAADQIDLNFAGDMLGSVGDSDVAVHGSILFRNLMRGFHRRIPFGQVLAARYGVTPLSEAEVRAALPQETSLPPGAKGFRQVAEEIGLLRETPAWLYFLCEARMREAGQRVGPTASHIIADTILGLMRANPAAPCNTAPGWHPSQSPLATPGASGLTTIRKLLLFAVKDTAVV